MALSPFISIVEGHYPIIDHFSKLFPESSNEIPTEVGNLINGLSDLGIYPAQEPDFSETHAAFVEYCASNLIPISAHIELIDQCNMRCEYCYCTFTNNRLMKVVSLRNLAEQLRKLNVFEVTLTGGEVLLLGEEFFAIVSMFYEYDFSIVILSNGSLFSAISDKSKQQLAEQTTLIRFSLHNTVSKTADEFTNFHDSLLGLVEAVRICKEYGINCSLACTLTKTNYQKIQELKDFAEGLEVSLGFGYPIVPKYNGDRSSLTLSPPYTAWGDILAQIEELGPLQHFKDESEWICNAGRDRIAIGFDGKVYSCFAWRQAVGDLRNESLTNIWFNSPLLDRIRNFAIGMAKCGQCSFRDFCSVCPGYNWSLTGNPTIPDSSYCCIAEHRMTASMSF